MTDQTRSDETAIHAVIAALSKALYDKDVAALFAVQDAGVVTYSLAPPLRVVGLDKAGTQAWFDTWIGGIEYQPGEQTIEVGGDIAYAHGLVRMGGTKTDGQANWLWFRQTLGFRRTADGWKIVHEHQSTPFYMDGSLTAAVDLNP